MTQSEYTEHINRGTAHDLAATLKRYEDALLVLRIYEDATGEEAPGLSSAALQLVITAHKRALELLTTEGE